MLQGEMNAHLGYENNSKISKETDNRRNGYITKNVKTSMWICVNFLDTFFRTILFDRI